VTPLNAFAKTCNSETGTQSDGRYDVSANKAESNVVKTATQKETYTEPGNDVIRDCLNPEPGKFLQSRELAYLLGAS
jgi:hypothetical protein